MPIFPSGPATFSVENTGTEAEDCALTLVPQDPDRATLGLDSPDATWAEGHQENEVGHPATGPTTEALEGDSVVARRPDTAVATMQGLETNLVAASGTSAITVQLQPGIYEVQCERDAEAEAVQPAVPEEGKMLVMVVDSAVGSGGARPQRLP
jgi:hypothetical protein